jgi:hypothetical protein
MIKPDISNNLLWDLDPKRIDFDRNKRLIIERVFTLGDFDDVKQIIRYYGLGTIKKEIVKAGNLDKKTLNWASRYFGIPKTKFACYSKKQSENLHWNY